MITELSKSRSWKLSWAPISPDSISPDFSHSHLFLLLIIASLSKHKLQPDKQSTDFSINIDSHEKQKEKGTKWRGVICSIYFRFQTYFSLRLVAWFPLSHSVCSSPLHQFFLLLQKDFKRIFKNLLALKKKKSTFFFSSGIKEMVGNTWAWVPSVLKKYSTDVAEKPHIQFYGNTCFDPFLPGHPNCLSSQGMCQTL